MRYCINCYNYCRLDAFNKSDYELNHRGFPLMDGTTTNAEIRAYSPYTISYSSPPLFPKEKSNNITITQEVNASCEAMDTVFLCHRCRIGQRY